MKFPFFSPTAEYYGVLHNIDFGVFWASWGGSGKEPGSGNRFRKLVQGTGSGNPFWVTGFPVRGTSSGNRIRVSMGSDRFCGSKVPVQKVA